MKRIYILLLLPLIISGCVGSVNNNGNENQEDTDTPNPPTSVPIDTPEPPTPVPPPGGGETVIINFLFYDGAVKTVESDEYAEITNTGNSSVNLSGWKLNAGAPSQDFYFPAYTLNPGESCGFSFGEDSAIWANKGDCGYLYDNNGNLVDEYCY